MTSELVYQYFKEVPKYTPDVFDIVGGKAEFYGGEDLEEDHRIMVVGMASASTVDPELNALFGAGSDNEYDGDSAEDDRMRLHRSLRDVEPLGAEDDIVEPLGADDSESTDDEAASLSVIGGGNNEIDYMPKIDSRSIESYVVGALDDFLASDDSEPSSLTHAEPVSDEFTLDDFLE